MSNLEQFLRELVSAAGEDATESYPGSSLYTRSLLREVRAEFTSLVYNRLNPLLNAAIEAARQDVASSDTREACGKILDAYDALANTDEF